jgi:hypothetical protein
MACLCTVLCEQHSKLAINNLDQPFNNLAIIICRGKFLLWKVKSGFFSLLCDNHGQTAAGRDVLTYKFAPVLTRLELIYPPASEASRGVYQKWA